MALSKIVKNVTLGLKYTQRNDTKHYDIQHNDTQHNDTKHNDSA